MPGEWRRKWPRMNCYRCQLMLQVRCRVIWCLSLLFSQVNFISGMLHQLMRMVGYCCHPTPKMQL